MSLTDVAGSANDQRSRDDNVQLLKAKAAFVLHELVDRVAHATEADRLGMHAQVADLCDGVSHAAARDSVADPQAYLDAWGDGAYDAPEAPPAPLTADQLRIQQLEAEIANMRTPATPPEQSPATSTPTPTQTAQPTQTAPGPTAPGPTAPGPTAPGAGDGSDQITPPPVTGAPDAPSS